MVSAVSSHHPNLWEFLDVIKKEQCLNNAITAQAMAGHVPPPPRQQYVTTARRIVQIVEDFNNCPMLEFLRGIAYNVRM